MLINFMLLIFDENYRKGTISKGGYLSEERY
jgi:hypothetical protein